MLDVHWGAQADCMGWNGVLLGEEQQHCGWLGDWFFDDLLNRCQHTVLCFVHFCALLLLWSCHLTRLPFAVYAPVSFIHCGCEFFATVVKTSLFCNRFHELLDFTFTNWLLGVPQCRLRFFQGSQIEWTTCVEFCWTLTHLQFQQFNTISVISLCKYSLRDTPVLFHQSSLPCFRQLFRPLHILHIICIWLPHKFKIFEVHLEVFLNSPCSKLLTEGVPQWVVQAFGIVTTQCTALP